MGMLHGADDSCYVGEYREGKRHGQGVYTFANGDRYWCALVAQTFDGCPWLLLRQCRLHQLNKRGTWVGLGACVQR